MHKHIRLAAVVLSTALLVGPALGQDSKGKAPAKGAAPSPAAPAAGAPSSADPAYDLILKERLAAGQPDTPQLREAVKEELQTREIVVREAKKKGLDKDPTTKAQMDLSSQNVLVQAYLREYLRLHPITDEALRKEYDTIKSQLGDKEYKARHILVEQESEAKEIISALQKGEKFEKLADRSKDPGSKANGGDLGWASPANFVKPFSDAMTGLQKGKFTPQPVRTQFGWHVILLEDVRDAKIPPFEEVKPQLMQRMQPKVIDDHLKELRAKAGTTAK